MGRLEDPLLGRGRTQPLGRADGWRAECDDDYLASAWNERTQRIKRLERELRVLRLQIVMAGYTGTSLLQRTWRRTRRLFTRSSRSPQPPQILSGYRSPSEQFEPTIHTVPVPTGPGANTTMWARGER